MFRGKTLTVLVLVCGLLLPAPAVSAAVPGLGSVLRRIFGGATVKKAAGKTAGKAITGGALRTGVKALPTAGRKITGSSIKTALAKSAPRSFVEKVTPGQILAVGGATGLVLTGNGAANAAGNLASHTGPALARVLDGTASSPTSLAVVASGAARDVSQTIVMAVATLAAFFGILLFWRFGLMPWQRRRAGNNFQASPSENVQAPQQPAAAENHAPHVSSSCEIVDAEIVGHDRSND